MRASVVLNTRGRRGLSPRWNEHCYKKRVDHNPWTWERRLENRCFRHSGKMVLAGYRNDWEDILLPSFRPGLRPADW